VCDCVRVVTIIWQVNFLRPTRVEKYTHWRCAWEWDSHVIPMRYVSLWVEQGFMSHSTHNHHHHHHHQSSVIDQSSCVDELSSLGGRLFGILRWSVSPFHVVSVVGTVPVKTSLETIHCRCHHHFLRQIVLTCWLLCCWRNSDVTDRVLLLLFRSFRDESSQAINYTGTDNKKITN